MAENIHRLRMQQREQSLGDDAAHIALLMVRKDVKSPREVIRGLGVPYWEYVQEHDKKYLKEVARLAKQLAKEVRRHPERYVPNLPIPQGQPGEGGMGAPPPPGGMGAAAPPPPATAFNLKQQRLSSAVLLDGTVLVSRGSRHQMNVEDGTIYFEAAPWEAHAKAYRILSSQGKRVER